MFPYPSPFGNPFGAPPIRPPVIPPGVPGQMLPGAGLPPLGGGIPLPGLPGGPPRFGPGPFPLGRPSRNGIPLRRRRSSAAPRMRQFVPGPGQAGHPGRADMANFLGAMGGMNLGGRGRSQSRGRMFDPTRGGARRRSRSRGRVVDPARGRSPGGILRNPLDERERSRQRSQSRSRQRFGLPRTIHWEDGVKYNENFGGNGGHGQSQGYIKVKSLTPGGMSEQVNLMRGRRDGQLYVEKQIKVGILGGRRARAEIETLKTVRGQHHLNQLIEYKMMHDGKCSMILEYCDGGSLSGRIDQLRQHGSFLNSAAVWNIVMGVARGLAFLHDGIENVHQENSRREGWDPICHLDLKPCNIFIHSQGGENGHQRIVLADFGCCITLSDIKNGRENEAMQECGTPEWYPPEGRTTMARRGMRTGYGTKTDIYMLGATAHVACRLARSPSQAQLRSDFPCGSRYQGKKLNRLVSMLCQDQFDKRPAARDVAVWAKQMVEGLTRRR